ncbi:hypothetical protein NE237_019757 [Protea cynaroides]|uniref:Uncharacterized protein n=1 Tax=Protea cynaroides TaxID=273540 RepID=A0A9Q0H9A5_9MAGN|nr:hypothetical protein NE237_019757 [Protea cynaroides]
MSGKEENEKPITDNDDFWGQIELQELMSGSGRARRLSIRMGFLCLIFSEFKFVLQTLRIRSNTTMASLELRHLFSSRSDISLKFPKNKKGRLRSMRDTRK